MKTLNLNKLILLTGLFIVSIDFDSSLVDEDDEDSGGANNNIMKMGADPIQLYLTVTD